MFRHEKKKLIMQENLTSKIIEKIVKFSITTKFPEKTLFEFELFTEFIYFFFCLVRGVKNSQTIMKIKEFILKNTSLYSKASFLEQMVWMVFEEFF